MSENRLPSILPLSLWELMLPCIHSSGSTAQIFVAMPSISSSSILSLRAIIDPREDDNSFCAFLNVWESVAVHPIVPSPEQTVEYQAQDWSHARSLFLLVVTCQLVIFLQTVHFLQMQYFALTSNMLANDSILVTLHWFVPNLSMCMKLNLVDEKHSLSTIHSEEELVCILIYLDSGGCAAVVTQGNGILCLVVSFALKIWHHESKALFKIHSTRILLLL